jgi:hypothetical protein
LLEARANSTSRLGRRRTRGDQKDQLGVEHQLLDQVQVLVQEPAPVLELDKVKVNKADQVLAAVEAAVGWVEVVREKA